MQELVVAAIGLPHAADSTARLRVALKAFRAVSETHRAFFHGLAQPLLHATFLRLFGLGRIPVASFDSLPLKGLHPILEGIVARSGLSGLQCLSDLVNGSLGDDPQQADRAYRHWMALAKERLRAHQKTPDVPYEALPSLIAGRLAQMAQRGMRTPVHVLDLMQSLMKDIQALPDPVALPALTQLALVALAPEMRGMTLTAVSSDGRRAQFPSAQVLAAMNQRKALSVAEEQSLFAVADVLALGILNSARMDDETIERALAFLARCPDPLIGCMVNALDIIGCLALSSSSRIQEGLSLCWSKRAARGLLPVSGGA